MSRESFFWRTFSFFGSFSVPFSVRSAFLPPHCTVISVQSDELLLQDAEYAFFLKFFALCLLGSDDGGEWPLA